MSSWARRISAARFGLAAMAAWSPAASAQAAYHIVHDFADTTTGGRYPAAPLLQTADGTFYGTTEEGGPAGTGTVFKMTADGTVTQLHAFGEIPDAEYPSGGLLLASDGNFYGLTSGGGPGFGGAIYRMTPSGSVTVLQTFDLFSTGPHDPVGTLAQAPDGYLYGVTENGGAINRGTIFRMALDGTFAVIHEFTVLDGGVPQAGLIRATDGNFYGTTTIGGGGPGCGGIGCGTVYRVTPAGDLTIIHTFAGGAAGDRPQASVVQARDGNLYGTTQLGGALNGGTIFRVSLDGAFLQLHGFGSLTEGFDPHELIEGFDGYFYGTTNEGPGFGCGGFGCGTIFRMDLAGSVQALHEFTGVPDGVAPYAGLTQAADGTLYGTTTIGGATADGTIFQLDPEVCRDMLTASYAAGTLDLRFSLKSAAASTWGAWVISSSGVFSLWSVPLGAVSPAVSFDLPIPNVPPSGPLVFLTALSTPAQGAVCFDLAFVDTGGGAARAGR